MKRIEYPAWDDDVGLIIDIINEVTSQISRVITLIEKQDKYSLEIDDLLTNLVETLNYWTGHTFVGCEKNEGLKQAFQLFFEELLRFLILCQGGKDSYLRDFANGALFQGTVYRYLGCGFYDGSTRPAVIPKYDGIFVSWSKVPQNTYLENKLYGTITKLTCLIDKEYYGIDLEPFGVVRGDESEVVFPTIEQTIKHIEFIEDESDEDSTF